MRTGQVGFYTNVIRFRIFPDVLILVPYNNNKNTVSILLRKFQKRTTAHIQATIHKKRAYLTCQTVTVNQVTYVIVWAMNDYKVTLI